MGKFIQRSLLHRRPNLLEDLWNFLSLFPDCHNTCWHQQCGILPHMSQTLCYQRQPASSLCLNPMQTLPSLFCLIASCIAHWQPTPYFYTFSPSASSGHPPAPASSAGLCLLASPAPTLILWNLAGPSPQPGWPAVSEARAAARLTIWGLFEWHLCSTFT